MAVKSPTDVKRGANSVNSLQKNLKKAFPWALIFLDSLLVSFIIGFVPYTKIDWDAYMSQVNGFLEGERDYGNLRGDTGSLVYPAGFLYVYTFIKYVTGGEVYLAQVLFGFLYIINLGIILFIYQKTDVLPWWALCLLCLSKRVHSIFALRLFNDCIAMTLLHGSLALLLYQRWHLGLVIFSASVSVKMNVLLYAPPLLLLMLKAMDISGVITALSGAALVQIILRLPFIISHPIAYLSKAFNLGRIFIHFWSVNFKFVPEPVFISTGFAFSLLNVHLLLLLAFTHYRWCKHEGGLFNFLHAKIASIKLRLALFLFNGHPADCLPQKLLGKNVSHMFSLFQLTDIVTTMFVGNFIGIICARYLRYQFYSWYVYSLPYLLWRTPFPNLVRIILFAGVELCWNIYPSTDYSSMLLLCIHMVILWGVWSGPSEHPYYTNEKVSIKKKR